MLSKITLVKDVNFGFNWLDEPDESYSQIVMNYVKFANEEGILCFYLFTKNDEHYLKPIIITLEQDKIKYYNYAIITGDKVKEIADVYFNMRQPFEKEVPNIGSLFATKITTEEITEEEFKKLFKSEG
jgi:hypothetical protein